MNKSFSDANRQRCESSEGFNHSLQSWNQRDWFLALTGEVGEAANILKKLKRIEDGIVADCSDEAKAALEQELRDEIADIYTYLDLFCQASGIDLEQAVVDKFNRKSLEIGYPFILERA